MSSEFDAAQIEARGVTLYEVCPDAPNLLVEVNQLIDEFGLTSDNRRDNAAYELAMIRFSSEHNDILGPFIPGALFQFALNARNVDDEHIERALSDENLRNEFGGSHD